MNNLFELAEVLLQDRDAVLARWREQVRKLGSARELDAPTLNDHIPLWLESLATSLLALPPTAESEAADVAASPFLHGLQRADDGFNIEEVVREYNILRDCVHGLAEKRGIDLRGHGRRLVDRAFDDAIGAAVCSFAESQAREVEHRRAEHLAFVAHDLRTPLSAITFASHILSQRLEAHLRDRDTSRLLKTLGRNAKQLETLVNQVLVENTQRLTEMGVQLERRSFDLWPIVETLLQDVQSIAATNKTTLVNEVPDELGVLADASLVRRILQNLISNAISYTPGGTVTVSARDLGDGLGVECSVRDTGAGIPADRIGKVFEPLETDPDRDGVGLGLAIVKTFVEAHHGVVSVESTPGSGSLFRFTLPRDAAAAAKTPRAPVESIVPAQ